MNELELSLDILKIVVRSEDLDGNIEERINKVVDILQMINEKVRQKVILDSQKNECGKRLVSEDSIIFIGAKNDGENEEGSKDGSVRKDKAVIDDDPYRDERVGKD